MEINTSNEPGEEQNEVQKKGRNENLLHRLKAFDKHYLEKISLVKYFLNLS